MNEKDQREVQEAENNRRISNVSMRDQPIVRNGTYTSSTIYGYTYAHTHTHTHVHTYKHIRHQQTSKTKCLF